MQIKVPCHIIDTEEDTDTETFWDGHLVFDGQGLHVDMHGRSGMGLAHAREYTEFDVPLDAVRDIEWKDRVVGSLIEISFREIGYADLFPGTSEDHLVELSIRESDQGLAEELVAMVKNTDWGAGCD